jgi:uncharacterized protein (DUF1800 family)
LASLPSSPIAVHRGPFTARQATRLLWRAGFGPTPGQAQRVAALGLDRAVASLTRPGGRARLAGAPPRDEKGLPIDPINVWGDAHVWWLDRMVRSNQPLVERMTLIWHSWFATSLDASNARLILRQNAMMRRSALGSFHRLLQQVTTDPAMLVWLSGSSNNKYSPNENYGREMMELFTLGADRGYTQSDVHNQARALTGWTNDWGDAGPTNFRFDPSLHDDGVKTIFGHRGRFDWRDSCRLCVGHRLHPSFLVGKLWGYFIPEPAPARVQRALERHYVRSGHQIRPLVEAILRHPLLYDGPRMVTPPVVFCAGMLRASGQTITTDAWSWIGQQMGQLLFEPPNVAGWDYTRWLDTARWAGRLTAVNYVLRGQTVSTDSGRYSATESAEDALAAALAFWGNPELSAAARDNLLAFGRRVASGATQDWEQSSYRALRQNGLRALIPMTPDFQTC